MATGFDERGESVKNCFSQLMALLVDKEISKEKKIRLIAVHLISARKGVSESEQSKLFAAASLNESEIRGLLRLDRLGVTFEQCAHGKAVAKPNDTAHESKYSVSRYTCPLYKIISSLCLGKESDEKIESLHEDAALEDSETEIDGKRVLINLKPGGISLRTVKPAWKQSAHPSSFQPDVAEKTFGEKIIVYVLGGCSYPEIHAAYSVGMKFQRDVLIGSSALASPSQILSHLRLFK